MNVPLRERPGFSSERGYTLLEVIVALAVTAILMGGVYSLYIAFFKKTSEQALLIEAQQDARAGVNTMEKDIILTGHDVQDTVSPIITADVSEVEFRYVNTDGAPLKVTYKSQNGKLVKQVCEQAPSDWTGCSDSNWYTVIENLDTAAAGGGLEFGYYDQNGASIAAPVASANLGSIRFMKATLVTKTSVLPTGQTKSVTASTEVRLRNLYLTSAGGDATEPAQPTGLEVREDTLGARTGICGRMRVRWDKDTVTADIAYYRVFYTLSGVEKNVKVSITELTDLGAEYEYTIAPGWDSAANDWNLQHTPSDGSAIKTYTVGIRSYDNSHNPSLLSTEVSGNPVPSRGTSTFGDGGANDTTVNPSKLAAVTGFTGTDGANDGEVVLSWTGYNTSTYPDISGFRVYRNTSDFSSYPVSPGGSVKWLANETGGGGMTKLASSATSFTDRDPALDGCRVYYYAIAPVNCDGTLVTDEGGDPNEKKYIISDYTVAYGDGAGSGTDSPSGSDTAPPDMVSPAAPVIGVRAGWKRVAVSLTQSGAADLDQTCVYVNPDAAYPALLSTQGADKCFNVNTGSTPEARLVPDSGGVFTQAELGQGQSTSFWHDSMTVESPSSPTLMESGTYSYGAVAFDLCGNGSDVSQAQDTTTLCGEDPSGKPEWPGSPSITASCCDDIPTCCGNEPQGVVLSWTPIPSDLSQPSSAANPYDLAGYRVFRDTNSDFSSATMVSGSAPFWGSSFNDASVADGNTYYYMVVATDCPYERLNPSEATIKGDMLSGALSSLQVGPVRPGKVQRDEKCPGSGNCTQDDHREILTGVDMNNSSGSGTGASSISGVVISGGEVTAVTSSSFYHNKATFFFRNTSASTLAIQGATISWVNSDAYLRKITIGGGRSGTGEASTDVSATPTSLTPTEADPYTRSISNIDLTGNSAAEVPAGSRYTPVTFEFKDSSGNPTVDMRGDKLKVTLNVKNGNDTDHTTTTSCVSYLTVSQNLEGVDVSIGPSVTATQQDKPNNPTSGYGVPGITGNNTVVSGVDGPIIVDAIVDVKVSSIISSNTVNVQTQQRVDVTSVKLYYKDTAKTVTTAPSTGYKEVAMKDSGGADCVIAGSAVSGTCSGTIPHKDGERVWYYIAAIDGDGNFERDPERGAGAYVYDQKTFSVCDVTPDKPTNLAGVSSLFGAGPNYQVALTWNAVTQYSNGTNLQAGDSITYKVYRGGVEIATTANTNYTDTNAGAGLASGNVYSYFVKAVNTCPKTSEASSTTSVCVGAGGQASINVSTNQINAGGSYTVTVFDCLGVSFGHELDRDCVNGTTAQCVHDIGGANSYKNTSSRTGAVYAPVVVEKTDIGTGIFESTVTTALDNSANLKVDPNQSSAPAYTDTIAVFYTWASPNTVNVTVKPNPCDTTPSAPVLNSVTTQGQNITVRWSAVTTNVSGPPIGPPGSNDLAGYNVYERVIKNDGTLVIDWHDHSPGVSPVANCAAGSCSVTFSADHGLVNKNIYYYKVTAYDTCSPTVKESAYSNTGNE
ncbi:MAG: prepilin-type N-terminal cleavage/methylation domain-containing protein [Deltaproteobacteria bacterium]|nr:prepilin-type N-terminal cleavage/methylation domain-containing protein [Deltaproteobacteria bacterium]